MSRARVAAILGYLALVAAGVALSRVLPDLAVVEVRPLNEPSVHRAILLSAAAFVVAAAIPFVPGAEIGFAMMVMLGGAIAPLVYLSMVAALSLAYLAGRVLPAAALSRGLRAVGLVRAADLVTACDGAAAEARHALLMRAAPPGLARLAARNRYLLLAALLNLPGNSLLGGGGGLAFVAGASRVFRPAAVALTFALAVAPVPLAFWLGAVRS